MLVYVTSSSRHFLEEIYKETHMKSTRTVIQIAAIKADNTQSTEEGKELARSIRGQFIEVADGKHNEPIESFLNSLVYRDMLHEWNTKGRAAS